MAKRMNPNGRSGKCQTWSKVPHDLPGSVSCIAVNLFAALMKFAKNKPPHTCHPKQETLCDLVLRHTTHGPVPVCIKTIQRAQQELVDARRLVVKQRKNTSSLYTLYPDKLAPDPRPEADRGSDPCVATGSDSGDRLEATPMTDELEPPEPVLTTSLLRQTAIDGKRVDHCAKTIDRFDEAIRAACPEVQNNSRLLTKCRKIAESCTNITDESSVLQALREMKSKPVRESEFEKQLKALADRIALPPF